MVNLKQINKKALAQRVVLDIIGNERLHERYGVPEAVLAEQQYDADAVRRLYYKNLLTDAEATNARKRIAKQTATILKMKVEVRNKDMGDRLADAVGVFLRRGFCPSSHPYRELLSYMANKATANDPDLRCQCVVEQAAWLRQRACAGEGSVAMAATILSWEAERFHGNASDPSRV